MADDPLIAFLNARIDEDEKVAQVVVRGGDYGAIVNAAAGRALREVEAKRRLVEVADTANLADDSYAWLGILKALAAVYSDHPDYRQEWAP